MSKEANKTAEKSFSFDSLDEVHENIQEESSAPNVAAIDAQQSATVETAKIASGNTDKAGTIFDPKLHAVNSDGEPSLTPLGKFRKKRGTSSVSTTNKELIAQQQTDAQKAAARAAGQLAADMMIGSCVTLLGEEWIPIGETGKQEPATFNEHENLRRAFGDYFAAKNISDFPPGMALSIALTSYMMPRFAAGKETQTRLAKAKIWITEKFNGMKKRGKKNAAQSNTGNDGERKDNAGKENGSDEPVKATRGSRT